MIRLESGQFGWDYVVREVETGESVLVQNDWDYPALAESFGWVLPCECGSSDGTVDCPCGSTDQFIREAHEWLDEHIGETAEDVGYFGG